MLGILLLFAYLVCGLVVADRLFQNKSGLVRLWLGLCTGLALMMWLPALFAFFMDFTRAAQLLGLAVAAALAGGLAWTGRRCTRNRAPFCGEIPWQLILALVLPLALLSGYLQYSHILRDVNGALHVGQSTYGDLCLHLGIATSLRGAAFPPDYSILPGAMLGYPFLADSMVTSMLLFGGDLAACFVLTGTLMMVLVYVGFILFAWELTHKKSAVVLAYVLMFINGGLGFLYTFDGVFKDATMLRNVFTGFYNAPTNMPDLNLRWVNVICDMMVPQRTLLTGWMMLLPALYMLVDAVQQKKLCRFLLLGVWAGMMPMIHTHSFFGLGLMSIGVMAHQLICAPRDDQKDCFLRFLCYGAMALLLALPQLLTWTFPQTVGGGSLQLRFNWVNNQGNGRLIDGYFWFWIKNVGLVYIFMVPAALSAKRGSLLRSLSLGALVIYAVAEIIQFQPNPYDNNKLFYVAYMIMLPTAALYLTRLWAHLRGIRGRTMLAVLFILCSTLSGALTIAREVISDYQLFSAAEVRAAEFIEEKLPADAVILTGNQHNNAVAALTGRDIVCGTGSYLYFHGIDYSAQLNAMTSMLGMPGENPALFEEYGVDYVYISDQERYNFAADENWFSENFYTVYDADNIRIYARTAEAATASFAQIVTTQ